jgi:putative autotransporter adhesin-like protein
MKRLFALFGCGALLGLAGCGGSDAVTGSNVVTTIPANTIVGSGVSATEARAVGGFEAVTVTAPLRVELATGGPPSLEITADDNVLALVRAEVRSGRLYLGLAPQTSFTRIREIVCRATAGSLRELDASAAARLVLTGFETDRLEVRLSGASSAETAGSVDELAIDASGASRFQGFELRSRSVRATLSGASYAQLRADSSLVADVSGASTLEYRGDPVVVSNVSGASVIRRVGP